MEILDELIVVDNELGIAEDGDIVPRIDLSAVNSMMECLLSDLLGRTPELVPYYLARYKAAGGRIPLGMSDEEILKAVDKQVMMLLDETELVTIQ